MSVSPADFELYSRVTGAPMPRSPQEQMEMAPEVYNFVRERQYEPSRLRKAANFLGTAALLGGAAYGLSKLAGDGKSSPRNMVNVSDKEDDDDKWSRLPRNIPKTPKGGPSGGSGATFTPDLPKDSPSGGGGGVVNNVSIEIDDDPW